MLHGLCFGEEAGARTLCFTCKVVAAAMKGTSSVRRWRLRSFCARIVPPMCFATSGCSCARSSMRFLNIWLQIALEWLLHCRPLMSATCVDGCRFATGCCETHCNGCMNVAWAMFWGGSRSTKPCVFPCKVVAAGDERYLVCAAVAAAVVFVRELFLLCVLQRQWLFLCA